MALRRETACRVIGPYPLLAAPDAIQSHLTLMFGHMETVYRDGGRYWVAQHAVAITPMPSHGGGNYFIITIIGELVPNPDYVEGADDPLDKLR